MKDVQKESPEFSIKINQVGIKNFKLPVQISERNSSSLQQTTADIECFVDLPENLKGIHMSRIPETIHSNLYQPLNFKSIEEICSVIIKKLEATKCKLIYKFPYFIKKLSPVTERDGLVHSLVTFTGIKDKDKYTFKLKVEVEATSSCPCSKELSDNSAHNQRSLIEITCYPVKGEIVWIEELMSYAESSASSKVYSILKRPDEKFVTEEAYNNSKFVEDICRECFQKLNQDPRIAKCRVEVTNYESIHQHNAYAMLE